MKNREASSQKVLDSPDPGGPQSRPIRYARRRAFIFAPAPKGCGGFCFVGGKMFRLAVLIDGGNLRVLTRQAGHTYEPDYIEKVAPTCVASDEQLVRILYYDCAPYSGTVKQPV
jgi:hypothetical protein